MQFRTTALPLALGALALAAAPPPGSTGDGDTAERVFDLSYKSPRDFSYVLPEDNWNSGGHSIDLGGFTFDVAGSAKGGPLKVQIDTDADGRFDEEVKGTYGSVELRAKDEDGNSLRYTLRIHNRGGTWSWAPGHTMSGKVAGEQIHLIDANSNGRYDEFGVDAMVIGRGPGASYLSNVVNLKDSLYELEVSADGSQVAVRPWVGDTALLDVHKGFKGKGSLEAVIIQDGDMSFNVAAKKGGLRVPAGEYELVSGFARRGRSESVRIGTGRMRAIALDAGDEQSLKWGGPLSAEFDHSVNGDQLTVQANVKYYGQAGEEYHTFLPDAKSPKILVKDANTGKLLESGRFKSC